MDVNLQSSFELPEKIKEEYTPATFRYGQNEFVGKLFRVRKFKGRDGNSSIIIKKCSYPLQSKRRAKLILRHLNLLRTIEHENIVRLIGSYSRVEQSLTDPNTVVKSVYTITDYCGEPMSKRIEKGDYSMEDVKKWMREMLLAVQHLHSNGVIHRNLHPGNICIDADGKLFLIAFGHARVIDRNQEMTAEAGKQLYSPIELQVDWVGPYDEKVDIWSIAALLCDLLTGVPLFSDNHSSLKKQLQLCGGMTQQLIAKVQKDSDKAYIKKHTGPNFIDLLCGNLKEGRGIKKADIMKESTNLRDFLDNTLVFDPDRRMSAERALAHPFLRSPQLWEQQLPTDDDKALKILEDRIDEEIALVPYEE